MANRSGGRPLPRQRADTDCGLAALSHYLHQPYEIVYVAAAMVAPGFAKAGGLGLAELQAVAKRLGCVLSVLNYRRVNLDEHTGILGLNWNKPRKGGHWVVLREGTIIDPWEPSTWDADEYLLTNNARLGHLLTEHPETRP